MTIPDNFRGGYHCPIPDCPFTAVVGILVADHIRQQHPETLEEETADEPPAMG